MAKNIKQLTVAPVSSINLAAALPPEAVQQLMQAELSNRQLAQQVDASLILVRRSIAAHVTSCRKALSSAESVHTSYQDQYTASLKIFLDTTFNEFTATLPTPAPLPPDLCFMQSRDKIEYLTDARDSDGDPITGHENNFTTCTFTISRSYSYSNPNNTAPRTIQQGYHTRTPSNSINLPFVKHTFNVSPTLLDLRQAIADALAHVTKCRAALDAALVEQGRLPQHEQDLRDSMTIAAARSTSDGNDSVDSFTQDILSRLNIPIASI